MKMARLTKTYADGTFGVADDLPCGENSWAFKDLLINQLGEYENAEEQGLLVRFPCKVGDAVYALEPLAPNGIEKVQIVKIRLSKTCKSYRGSKCKYNDWGNAYWDFRERDFGKSVFLTEAEASQALKSKKRGVTMKFIAVCDTTIDAIFTIFECSNCGECVELQRYGNQHNYFKFCPHCGEKNEKEE